MRAESATRSGPRSSAAAVVIGAATILAAEWYDDATDRGSGPTATGNGLLIADFYGG